MKSLRLYHVVFIAVVTAIAPLSLAASQHSSIDKPMRREVVEFILPMFQDSTAKRKTETKPAEPQKSSQDVQDARLKEAQRRSIKQVPRSIPKLKPQPVTDRGVRKPPMKIPKKGMDGHRF